MSDPHAPETPPVPTEDLLDGRYRVIETLGQGTFGRTVLAEEADGGRRVAIKSLRPEKADGLKAFELFEREAKVLGALRHHGIPAIYDSFRARWEGADAAFLVMEYVRGRTLEQMITDGHVFEADEVASLVLDLTGILQYLHERLPPILHRDIKPANVILRDGRSPVLVDFGAVRNVFHTPQESGSTVVGTYGYMPYEQYMGQATPASDLYALGATLLHLLTRRPPSDFLSDEGRIDVPGNVPGGDRIREVLVKLLAPAPTDRYPSADALRNALLRSATAAYSAPAPASMAISVPTRARAETTLAELTDVPRSLTGTTLERFRDTSYHGAMMDGMALPGGHGKHKDRALFVFLSIVSVGLVPLIYWIAGRSRRNRIRPFFVDGKPAVGVLQSISSERTGLGEEQLARVTYDFEADGEVHRGADGVLPRLADRWRVNDAVPVLYLADRNYDSIIVAMP